MRTSLSLLIIILLTCVSMQAQTNDSIRTKKLLEVEVSAQSKPTVALSATPLQIITSENILEQGLYSLSDAIKRFNGVVLKDYGGIGGLKTVSIRGMGAEYTGISYDGIMINNVQSGQVDISRFALDNVSLISLNIGQSDDIFLAAKAFATAGVLSLETTPPEFKHHNYTAHAKVTAGSFGLFNPTVNYTQKLNKTFALSANGNWQRADGAYPFTQKNDLLLRERKRKNSDVNTYRTEVNVYSDFGKSGQLNAKVYYFDSERGLPGNVKVANDYAAERVWDKDMFAQVAYNRTISGKLKLKSRAKYDETRTKYTDTHDKYINGQLKNVYKEKEAYLSNSLLYGLDDNLSFSLAEDLSYNKLNSETLNKNIDSRPPERYNSYTALAAKYTEKRLTVTSSLLATYITEKRKNNPDNIYKKLSPALTASYQPFCATNLRVRASYKHSFRVPIFAELYYSAVEKNLKPESAKQYNVGLTWVGQIGSGAFRYINASVDGYYNKVDDKIVIIPKTFAATSINMDVEIKGVDVRLASNILIDKDMNIDLSATYSLMQAIDATGLTEESYKDQIPYTPLHSGSGTITFNNRWVNFSYSILAVSKRYSMPVNEKANEVDGYSDHSISLFKRLKLNHNELYIQGSIQNLWDKNYEVIAYYPMPGRSYQVSVGYKF